MRNSNEMFCLEFEMLKFARSIIHKLHVVVRSTVVEG